METTIKLRIHRGEIIQFPPIAHGPKPRRWCAVITRDYRRRDTIHREMLPITDRTSRISTHFDASTLKLHKALEFGLEWRSGRPSRLQRAYLFGVIIGLTADHLVLDLVDTAIGAIELGLLLETSRRKALREQLRAIKAELDDPLPF